MFLPNSARCCARSILKISISLSSAVSCSIRTMAVRFCSAPCSFFFQAEDGIRYSSVTGVQTCALPILQCFRLNLQGVLVRFVLQRLLWSTNRTKTPCKFSRKHCAEHRRFVRFRPGHFRACAMVRKVIQPQPESVSVRTRIKAHDVAESFELFRLPVRGEPHDFVLVAKFQKAKILRHGRVKKPERMRKGHRSADEHAMALARAPHGAGEIAKSVGGQQRSAFERRAG